jgi:hypothetical protein
VNKMNVSPTNSKLLYGTKPHAISNGEDEILIKVRLRDHKNNPVSNRLVELVADRAGVEIVQPQATDENGLATGTARATTPGPVHISARVFPPAQSSSSN